jgi:hypothetical protein
VPAAVSAKRPDLHHAIKEPHVIETNSPLDNLAACAVAYLAGILLTLLLMSYINALLAQERERHKTSLPFPDIAPSPAPSES